MMAIYQNMKDLTTADKDLANKVASIEVLVAGDYVKKDDFHSTINAMFAKLDRIEDKEQ